MKIWQSFLVMLAVAIMLGFSSIASAKDSFGCAWCNVDDPVCQGDNCNDGEGNQDAGNDTGTDTGTDTGGETSVAKSDDDDDKEKLIGAAVAVGVLMAIIDASQSDEEKLQARQEFRQGKRGMVVPHLNVTERGHSYGLQYEMRF